MKHIYLFLIVSCVNSAITNAQEFACTKQYYCSLNLQNPRFSNNQIDSTINKSYGKSNPAFHDVGFAKDGDCFTTTSCSQKRDALFYNVYFPKNTDYTHYNDCPLPVIVLFHGGGYSDCATLDNSPIVKYICVELAKRGYVAFDVEYRAGRLVYGDNPNFGIYKDIKTIYQQLGYYRAVQDGKGACRSIIKQFYDNQFGNAFRIDTSKMFVGGQSAGCGIALALAYLQKQDMMDEASPGIHARLGSINADYYYADTSYPLPAFKGIFSMWGGLPMPGKLITSPQVNSFFTRNNYIPPIIAFHGILDEVVPYNSRYENFPNSNPGTNTQTYDTTSFCLDSAGLAKVTHTTSGGRDLRIIGSEVLHDLVKNAGKPAEVYLDCQMLHGLDGGCSGSPCIYQSDFGTGLGGAQPVTLYMVQRAACFFQSVLTGSTLTGTSKFTECKNTRNSCAASSANGCSNSDNCSN